VNENFISRFIKGLFSTGIGTFFQIVLGFLGLMIAVRYIPKEQFGIFVLLQVIASLFTVISSLIFENISVTRLITTEKNGQKMEVANTAICYKLLIVVIMGLVILPCDPLIYLIFKSEQLSRLLIYIPLFFILSSFEEFLLGILQGFHQFKKMAISQIINGGVKFLLIIIFLVVLKMDVIGLIYSFLFSFAASIIFQYLVIPGKKQFNFNPMLFKKIFRFGFPLGLNNILTFIFMKIDRFMIGAMISPIGVAYYEVADKIPSSSHRMYESFRSVFFPNMTELFAQGRYEEAEKVLNNSLRLISFAIFFAATIATLFQKEIVCLLFSEKYLDSAPAFSLLTIGIGIGIIGNILGTTLVALGQSDKPVKINMVDSTTNIICNLIMIPIFGFMGAVYATLLSRCATNPFIVWFLIKYGLKVRISDYLKPLLALGICVIPFLIFGLENIIIKLFLIILFLCICFFLSIIKKNDLRILLKVLNPSSENVAEIRGKRL
jgi:O-antigen/teichoic acid export membrane protein